jgi:hypothetical protein
LFETKVLKLLLKLLTTSDQESSLFLLISSVTDETSKEIITTQVDAIRKLFLRQLQIPMYNLRDAFIEYHKWEESCIGVTVKESEDVTALIAAAIAKNYDVTYYYHKVSIFILLIFLLKGDE